MKIVLLVFTLIITVFICKAQGTPDYQYAILNTSGHNWNIYYEDSTRHLVTGVDPGDKERNARVFKALHFLNQQGYELIGYGYDQTSTNGYEYYFKRPKRMVKM